MPTPDHHPKLADLRRLEAVIALMVPKPFFRRELRGLWARCTELEDAIRQDTGCSLDELHTASGRIAA